MKSAARVHIPARDFTSLRQLVRAGEHRLLLGLDALHQLLQLLRPLAGAPLQPSGAARRRSEEAQRRGAVKGSMRGEVEEWSAVKRQHEEAERRGAVKRKDGPRGGAAKRYREEAQ
eukprot:850924-Rhodomonas_salina.1